MIKMYEICERESIKVHITNKLGNGVDGIYLDVPGMPKIIGLNKQIMSNTPYARCVFAEELGHHYTTVGECVPKEYYCYADRIAIYKAEYKALRWAANYLIPEHSLLDALRDNICEVWELAEHFNVTEDMVKLRVKLFKGE